MKQLLVALMLVCTINAFAQDVIVKKNGSTVVCRVVEVNTSEVVYKKWNDLNGANFILNRTDVASINYENGKKEELSTTYQNEFTPGNQNTGEQSLNDIALMKLDIETNGNMGKAKKLRTIGWIGGATLVLSGAICAIVQYQESSEFFINEYKFGYASVALGVAGVAWTTGFLIAANKHQKMAESVVINSPILQNEHTFKNGTSLAYSAELLKDNLQRSHTVGIGFRYNF